MKRLIVTGDDFGASRGISRGIVDAHERGILTSTSLLVDRPTSEHAAALARRHPNLSVGLHLELDAVTPERVTAECRRQLARFCALIGAPPTHIDSHHDVHRDPLILRDVLALARGAGEGKGVLVRGHSAARHVGKFYGRWGGATHPEQIGVDGLLRLLDTELRDGVTELSCHPGYVDPDFDSTYLAEREMELRTLRDPRVQRGLEERAIHLIGFHDLAAPTVPATERVAI